MKKTRLDLAMVSTSLARTRSQAENYIKLGMVNVNGRVVTKAGQLVLDSDKITLNQAMQFVGRGGLKLATAAEKFGLNFRDKIVLDVGSSTGGFTDFALQNGAKKVIAVDSGSGQLHHDLRLNPKVELYEKTDIRNFNKSSLKIDIVLVDVSFISLTKVLPAIAKLSEKNTIIVALLKPQFEAGKDQLHKGIVKNNKIRRQIIANFEDWLKKQFIIKDKLDSPIMGAKGNQERFYQLTLSRKML